GNLQAEGKGFGGHGASMLPTLAGEKAQLAPGRPGELHWSVDAASLGDPVGLPGLAPVGGERLLPGVRAGLDVRPAVADEDAPPLVQLLVVELAHSVLELTDDRHVENGALHVDPVQTPLPALGVVEP